MLGQKLRGQTRTSEREKYDTETHATATQTGNTHRATVDTRGEA